MPTIDALKILTSISEDFITAGRPSTITTKITNAHDDKIELMELYYFIPQKVRWISETKVLEEYENPQPEPVQSWSSHAFRRVFKKPGWKKTAYPEGVDMVLPFLTPTPETDFSTLLPGESYVYSFEAVLPRWLFESGFTVKFDGRVKYKYKNEIHYSVFSLGFLVRPPIEANIIGAIIGGLLGTLAKWLLGTVTTKNMAIDTTFITATALSMILGVVMVVFSSRRTGTVQPILTIEDFWGGMLAGFLVGYLGHEYFDKAVTGAK